MAVLAVGASSALPATQNALRRVVVEPAPAPVSEPIATISPVVVAAAPAPVAGVKWTAPARQGVKWVKKKAKKKKVIRKVVRKSGKRIVRTSARPGLRGAVWIR